MVSIVRMPKLGMEMQEGELIEWHVSEGEEVKEGDAVAEIESEKTVQDVEARESGVVRELYLQPGAVVEPGTPMAVIAGPDESLPDLEAELPDDVGDGDEQTATQPEPDGATAESAGDGTESDAAEEIKVAPAARKRAEELGLDPTDVDGTGPGGVITSDDIEAAASTAPEPSDDTPKATPKAKKVAAELDVDISQADGTGPQGAVTAADLRNLASADDDETTVRESTDRHVSDEAVDDGPAVGTEYELSGMRQTIASRLSESYRNAVHVTVHRDIPVDELQVAKDRLDSGLDADISLVDVLLVVLSETLDAHPTFNATFEDGTVSVREDHDVGIAVDVDDGLVTPVLTGVQERSVADIVEERTRLTEAARNGEFGDANLEGGSITVTNLGPFGVDAFTPIIDPPQVAILGIGRTRERAVPGDDGVAFQLELGVSLTFDHRIADGADAARFLQTFEQYTSEPWPLLIDRL